MEPVFKLLTKMVCNFLNVLRDLPTYFNFFLKTTERLWTACAIFCKRKGSDTFYSPRLDLNDLKVDPYFPDGTWCHTSGKQSYYCLEHLCLPDGVSNENDNILSIRLTSIRI